MIRAGPRNPSVALAAGQGTVRRSEEMCLGGAVSSIPTVSLAAPIDAYLATQPPDQRDALLRLRAQIARLLPDAEETISYGLPAFTLKGRAVVWFAGWKAHCSIYPLTDSFLQAHAAELSTYRRTKGSLHFTPDAPLPDKLIESLLRARLADLEGGP